jgi:putative tryptophan/tyrosine transport system substrate-binding protein
VRRREFITLLGGATAGWPLSARAQQATRVATIGFLDATSRSTQGQIASEFVKRLRELGWREGQNLVVEVRWAEGRPERYAEIAAEFVRLKVDVIVTYALPAIFAAKKATSTIPIVFAAAGDPVENGLVASLSHPGGNVTGLSNQTGELAGKRIEILREIVPTLHRLAVIGNVTASNAVIEMQKVAVAARTLGIEYIPLEIQRAADIDTAIVGLTNRVDALYVTLDPLINTNRLRINTLALGARLPTAEPFREFVEAAGLMSYGPNLTDLYRRAGDLVDKILKGAKPGDIPIEQPTKYDLIVNLTTAKAIGVTFPPALLVRADEVIE